MAVRPKRRGGGTLSSSSISPRGRSRSLRGPIRWGGWAGWSKRNDTSGLHRAGCAAGGVAEGVLGLAGRGERGLKGPDQVGWLERLEKEHANLRAAMGWALSRGEAETAARGWAVGWVWWGRGDDRAGARG